MRLRLSRLTFIVSLAFLPLLGCGGNPVPGPLGDETHRSGPVQDPAAIRSALQWGSRHAQTAKKTLEEHYVSTVREGDHIQRARVRTRWSRLALHAAERALSSQEPDPQTVERVLKGPPLTITLLRRGYHKGVVTQLDMVLVQGSHRVYAPQLTRRSARAVKDDGRVIAYEGEMEGNFPLDDLNLRKSASLEVRLEDGSFLYFSIPLWRLK
ncbi:MAG: hypothetical protein ACE5JS_10720 [Nitrospinota bacterium]